MGSEFKNNHKDSSSSNHTDNNRSASSAKSAINGDRILRSASKSSHKPVKFYEIDLNSSLPKLVGEKLALKENIGNEDNTIQLNVSNVSTFSPPPENYTPQNSKKKIPRKLIFDEGSKSLVRKRLWDMFTETLSDDKENGCCNGTEPGVCPLDSLSYTSESSRTESIHSNETGSTTATASEAEHETCKETSENPALEDDLADITLEKLLEEDIPIDDLMAWYDVTCLDMP